MGVDERRARLAVRHRLAAQARAETPVKVARDLVGLHSSDPATVFLAARARLRAPEVTAIERALYDDRTLLRILCMRRTLFVLPLDLAAVVQVACTRAVAERQRRRIVRLLEQNGIAQDADRWLREVEEQTVRALVARGEAAGAEISRDVSRLREQVHFGEGKKWGGTQSVATFVLSLLSMDGRIVRGRPRGSWISSQYRWVPAEEWLRGEPDEWSTEAAQAELARRWLRAFGPATAADLKWWTGWTAAEVKRALAEVAPVEIELDGEAGLVLADDLEPVPAVDPWVALLPALDPTVMGWTRRDWYLGPYAPALFDRSGNAGPTVWSDGRVVGGWAQRRDGEISFRLFEDVGADAVSAVEVEAERLGAWFGEIRPTPRFRTPLERELVA
jgi:hypothetical protein